jgi:RNA recognition motif-containing protein
MKEIFFQKIGCQPPPFAVVFQKNKTRPLEYKFFRVRGKASVPCFVRLYYQMKSIPNFDLIRAPSKGDDRLKIFLSNLDGRINAEELHEYFSSFGTIEHIESWTRKSAIILFSNPDSIDRVLSKHRKCMMNQQEFFIRRIRYGYIERAYMDSAVLFIKPLVNHPSIEWNDSTIRHCLHQYEMNIKQIRIVSKYLHAYIHFKDYDIVDQILLQTGKLCINGVEIEMKRAKCHEEDWSVNRLIEKNQVLKKQIERKKFSMMSFLLLLLLFVFVGQKVESHDEIKYLRKKIKKLKAELSNFKSRSHHYK